MGKAPVCVLLAVNLYLEETLLCTSFPYQNIYTRFSRNVKNQSIVFSFHNNCSTYIRKKSEVSKNVKDRDSFQHLRTISLVREEIIATPPFFQAEEITFVAGVAP